MITENNGIGCINIILYLIESKMDQSYVGWYITNFIRHRNFYIKKKQVDL